MKNNLKENSMTNNMINNDIILWNKWKRMVVIWFWIFNHVFLKSVLGPCSFSVDEACRRLYKIYKIDLKWHCIDVCQFRASSVPFTLWVLPASPKCPLWPSRRRVWCSPPWPRPSPCAQSHSRWESSNRCHSADPTLGGSPHSYALQGKEQASLV